jgi:hypothetical protein
MMDFDENVEKCYTQFIESNPNLEIDFYQGKVHYRHLIPDKTYICFSIIYNFIYETNESEKKYYMQPVIYKNKSLETESWALHHNNKYKYHFCHLNGEDFSYPFNSVVRGIQIGPYHINEFEFDIEHIILYEYTEGFPPCK